MFPSLPSPHVCDHSSPSSIAIAQTVSRSWYNLDPRLWFTIPERITFHPDGTGVISSPYDIISGAGGLSEVLSHSFTWKLERNGPLGMEEMDDNALFDTIPKLVSSSKAWTHKTWGGGVVPAYLHIDLVGTSSFESNPLPPTPDPFIINTSEATFFPPELLEYIFLLASEETVAARELLGTCRRAREMVMRRRRREMFPALAKRFASNGMAVWINCGHFNSTPDLNPSTSFYGMEAKLFKFPPPCGYPEYQSKDWRKGWGPNNTYYSCKLVLPEKTNPTLWQWLRGDRAYDAHPEVQKAWY